MSRKKTYKNNIRVVNLQGYTTPEIKEHYNKEWVTYGENNDYFDNLINLYLSSPTNSCCINGIVDMIYGRGIDSNNDSVSCGEKEKDNNQVRDRLLSTSFEAW